jgi:predicted nucleic acid binding AN1-type Zn finger protein
MIPNKKIGFVLILSLFLIPIVNAKLTIDIDAKESFGLGEKIYFNYYITSDSPTEITFIPNVDCPDAPVALSREKTINLTTDGSYSDVYTGIIVDDFIEPQTCTAYIQIISPTAQRLEKNFRIITSPSFEFELMTCKDPSCTEKAKIFAQNQNIYLDYESDVSGLSVSVTLTKPDKSTSQLTLPTTIKANQVGTYTVKATASKQGYKTIEKTTQFGVIKKEATIKYAVVKQTLSLTSLNIVIILVALVTLILLVVGLFKVFGKKFKDTSIYQRTEPVIFLFFGKGLKVTRYIVLL